MENNKGFSLVEILVCLAIVGVLLSFLFMNTGVINNYNTKEAAKKLNSSILNCRMYALSKSLGGGTLPDANASSASTVTNSTNVYLKVYKNSKNEFICDLYVNDQLSDSSVSVLESKTFSTKKIKIRYTDSAGGVHDVTSSNAMIIGFDRSSGAFLPMSDGNYITNIEVHGARITYDMKLYSKTGKTEFKSVMNP